MKRSSSASPDIPWMILGFIGGAIIGGALEAYVFHQTHGLLTIIFAFIGVLVGFKSVKYKTWDERIYTQLAEYQPVGKEAYRALQELADENNLTSDQLREWAYEELERVSPRKLTAADIARQKFASK